MPNVKVASLLYNSTSSIFKKLIALSADTVLSKYCSEEIVSNKEGLKHISKLYSLFVAKVYSCNMQNTLDKDLDISIGKGLVGWVTEPQTMNAISAISLSEKNFNQSLIENKTNITKMFVSTIELAVTLGIDIAWEKFRKKSKTPIKDIFTTKLKNKSILTLFKFSLKTTSFLLEQGIEYINKDKNAYIATQHEFSTDFNAMNAIGNNRAVFDEKHEELRVKAKKNEFAKSLLSSTLTLFNDSIKGIEKLAVPTLSFLLSDKKNFDAYLKSFMFNSTAKVFSEFTMFSSSQKKHKNPLRTISNFFLYNKKIKEHQGINNFSYHSADEDYITIKDVHVKERLFLEGEYILKSDRF